MLGSKKTFLTPVGRVCYITCLWPLYQSCGEQSHMKGYAHALLQRKKAWVGMAAQQADPMGTSASIRFTKSLTCSWCNAMFHAHGSQRGINHGPVWWGGSTIASQEHCKGDLIRLKKLATWIGTPCMHRQLLWAHLSSYICVHSCNTTRVTVHIGKSACWRARLFRCTDVNVRDANKQA